MQHLVKLITFEGQAVLDPFMGSGSTGVACKELNRDFIGYEINKEYYKIAQRRIYDG
ncbi:site-specific DNA-methyltransferase [Bernardetia sp.]|uniref:site-specific DNA-methyltransferase n=1 Tax=Bernardetia sp. TaxID=1937974 RepID=UPI0025BEC181|nr:site-specific DNA-methyltransferase [Bernardetia sp.]